MSFGLSNVRVHGGEETSAFSLNLVHDGRTVAYVTNSGTGGCHSWRWEQGTEESRREFHDVAVLVSEYDFEEDDALVWDMLMEMDVPA